MMDKMVEQSERVRENERMEESLQESKNYLWREISKFSRERDDLRLVKNATTMNCL